MKIIDAHAHVGHYGGFFNVGITADELIRLMDVYEIEKTVISDLHHETIRAAITAYPDRLIGAVWVNPLEGENAVTMVKQAVLEEGFTAVKLHPLLHAFVADDTVVHPVIRAAAETGVPVFIHSGHPPFSLPWSIGGLASAFPEVKMVQVHMGHGHGVYIQAAIDTAKKNPNLYLETSGMPMHTKIKEAYDQVGADRIMFGTDIPFHHPSVEIQRSRVSGLGDAELENLFYNNAAALLGL
jgi:hypothetical protein